MDTRHIEVAIANYRTTDLTTRAVWSLRSAYPTLPITIVDNGATAASVAQLQALADEAGFLTLIPRDDNLHHGPSLDLVIRQGRAEWILLFDSDCILFRGGLLEAMLALPDAPGAYMIGGGVLVDDMGYTLTPEFPPDTPTHRYIHPKCALVRRADYGTLPAFEKHGVPCLANERAAAERSLNLVDFPVDQFVYHMGRGTVERNGYGLGVKGRLYQLRHYLHALRRG